MSIPSVRHSFPTGARYLDSERERLRKHPYFIGVELEVAHDYCGACDCEACYYGDGPCEDKPGWNPNGSTPDFFSVGYDCSIEPGGHEFRSVPMSPQYFYARKADLDKALKDWRDDGARSDTDGNCGMHIHVNRPVFRTFQFYKVLKFFEDNTDHVRKFSRRSPYRYRVWCNTSPQRRLFRANGIVGDAKELKTNRSYSDFGVRLSTLGTVEFRTFCGTLDPTRFWGNMEFVYAIIDYAGRHSVSQMTMDGFCQFAAREKKTYPYLKENLEDLCYL